MTSAMLDEFVDELGGPDDPAADYVPDVPDDDAGHGDADVSRETPPPPPRRRPGPPPNPNSARQRKKAAKATPPRKRVVPNRPAAAAAEEMTTNERGALTVLGWLARPLAMSGLGLQVAAAAMPEDNPRRAKIGAQGEALALDALTLTVYGPPLAKGAAGMADSLPWMAQVLQKAAKISPYAALTEAAGSILLQVLTNHGLMPAHPVLGTLTPDELRTLAGITA